MLAPVVIAVALAAASPASTVPDAASPVLRIEHGRIVRVSPRPAFVSGVFATYADFDVVAPGGAQQKMYLLWMTTDQFLPEVGSVCTISYRSEPLLGGNLHDHSNRISVRDDGPHNVVQGLECGSAPPA